MERDLAGPGVTHRRGPGGHRGRAAGRRDRRQPGRRLEDQAGRHGRRQRLVGPAGARRPDAPGRRAGPAAARGGRLAERRAARHRGRRRRAGQPGALRGLAGQQARQPRAPGSRRATSCCPGAVHKMVPVDARRRVPRGVRAPRRRHRALLEGGRSDGVADHRPGDRRHPASPPSGSARASRSSATTTPTSTVETAYAAQKAFVQSKLDAGETFVGWKLGLTSRNKQQAMGLDAPLYGRVTSGMLSAVRRPGAPRPVHPPARGVRDRVPAGPRHRRRRPPSPRCWPRPRSSSARSTCSTPATRASSSRSPTSSPTTPAPAPSTWARSPGARASWRTCGCSGASCGWTARSSMTAAGAAVMGHPAASVAWLANQLAASGEEGLQGRAARVLRRGHRAGAGGRRRQRHLRVRPARRHRGVRCLTKAAEPAGAPARPTAVVPTDAAARYAKQLLAHLGRKAGVEALDGEPDGGRLVFGYGTGTVRPAGRPPRHGGDRGRRGGARRASRTCSAATSNASAPAAS